MSDGQVKRLLDQRAIEQVLIRYCIALDRMDLQVLASLFTPDCQVDYGSDPRLKANGSSDLARSLERMWRWRRTSHNLSNVVIAFEDDDTAVATSYVHAWHERSDGTTATILGQYHDRLVRRSGAWLIAERRMVMNGCDAGFTVPIHPLERAQPPEGWVAPDIDCGPGQSGEGKS